MSEGDHSTSGTCQESLSGGSARARSFEKKARSARPLVRRILRSLPRLGAPRLPAGVRDARQVIAACHALVSERGDVSGARLATEVLTAYQSLDAPARHAFFDLLADGFSPNSQEVVRAADAYCKQLSQAALFQLQAAVESPRQELFRRLNLAPGGIGMLIGMRRQLMNALGDHPEWAWIDADLLHLFRSWFNGGFLVLRQLDWRTSAFVLERLIQYEAVHQIRGWDDLHRRLEADRRCYAFFHPALPDEPLIFIEVALTCGMGANVQPLLDPDSVVVNPAVTNCAIFYSITNCQEGLRGVSFGNLLIKRVVEDLGRKLPQLRTFATLSPVPVFRKWLATALESPPGSHETAELAALRDSLCAFDSSTAKRFPAPLRDGFIRLCAHYLLHAKLGREPLDPVARFHLVNGARLERLNWLGDTSESGIERSLGVMANYVYRLADFERNHEAYAREYRIVASREVQRLARESPLARASGARS